MAKESEQPKRKKQRLTEVIAAMVNGDYDQILQDLKLGIGSFDKCLIPCLAFLISETERIFEKDKPGLTAVFISSVKIYGDDEKILRTCAMAIANMGTAYLVDEAIEGDKDLPPEKKMNDDELERVLNLSSAISILDMIEDSEEQTPDGKNTEAPDLDFADVLKAAPAKIHVFAADDTANELSPGSEDLNFREKPYYGGKGSIKGRGSKASPVKPKGASPLSSHYTIIALWVKCRPRVMGPKPKKTYIEVNGFLLQVIPEGVVATDGQLTRLLPEK